MKFKNIINVTFATKLAIISLFTVFISNNSFARNNIQIVGSSTVYPFTTVIAEEFGINSEFKTPIVEATGTGGGMKLFCQGIGKNYPDFTNASRKIKESEIAKCKENGVSPIEIKIGYDGIVIANSVDGQKYSFTKEQVFLALAKEVPSKNNKLIENPYKKWSDINKSLPNIEITIYGPPATSGTRDAFLELVMQEVCMNMEAFKNAYPDQDLRQRKCHIIRSDGGFIEAGENDNLIVQKLRANKDAFGIFGFSFLEENLRLVQAVVIDGVDPSFDNIISGQYLVSRPLFIYLKKEHISLVAGMKEFVEEVISEETLGQDGYLVSKGLVPLSNKELKKLQETVKNSISHL